MKKRTQRVIHTLTPRNAMGLNRVSTRPILFCFLVLFVTMFVTSSTVAQSAQAGGSQQPQLMDRDDEIALALSAATVASKAAVYVLEKSGYVKIRDSQNGFTAIVEHTMPTSRGPQCMDAEGARTILPRYLKVAELRAQGKTQEEIDRFVADVYAKGIFQAPSKPGIDYMLSTANTVRDDKGNPVPFPPHLMFYAPYMTNADIGSDGERTSQVFIAGEGTPQALIIVPLGAHATAAEASATKPAGSPQK